MVKELRIKEQKLIEEIQYDRINKNKKKLLIDILCKRLST